MGGLFINYFFFNCAFFSLCKVCFFAAVMAPTVGYGHKSHLGARTAHNKQPTYGYGFDFFVGFFMGDTHRPQQQTKKASFFWAEPRTVGCCTYDYGIMSFFVICSCLFWA
jgi:hypothetical protein